MKKERSAYLFQQYIDQKCSAAEKAELMEMLNHSDLSNHFEELLDRLWDKTTEVELDRASASKIFNKVMPSTEPILRSTKASRFKLWWGWAAAAVLVAAFVSLFSYNLQKKKNGVAQAKPNPVVAESIVESTLYEHKKVTLPDGSTVILNKNSRITYTKGFIGDKRNVYLKGEGYFDIKHNAQKAFIVYTGKLKTMVLGTAFNVKAYDVDKNIVVTVTRGKVSVLNGESVLGIISPNEQVVFNKEHKKSNLAKVTAKNVVQWQESDLFFDDITMEEAAQILSKQFNTPINFSNDKVKKCKFTATFLKGESLNEILKIICTYNNAQALTTASGITIKGEGCG